MYCIEGKAFLSTMTRQRTTTKQLATLCTCKNTSTLRTLSAARSRKSYTTLAYTGDNLKDQQQSFNSILTPLGQRWPFRPMKRHSLRFKSTTTSMHFAEHNDHGEVTINTLATPLTIENYQATIEEYGALEMGYKTITDMMGIYDDMLTQGVRPTSTIYAIIIRSLCARDEQVNRATNAIRREMDINTYVTDGSNQLHPISVDSMSKARSSLGALESENNLQQAVAIFEQAIGENKADAFDVELYNTLLHGLSYTGNSQDGLFVYEQLENSHVRPNSTTFAMLLSLFGKAGDLQAVNECFKEYKTIYRRPSSHSHGYVYYALVSAYVDAGDLPGALHLVENTMVNNHIPVTIASYNKILYRASTENNMELISRILHKLTSNDQLPKPDTNTYGILLSAYSRSRNLDKAHDVFEKVKSMELDRQYSHLNEYIAACVDKNELGQAMNAIRTMSAHGMELHINQCCKVISSYLGAGDMRGAADAVKEMIQLQSRTQLINKTSPLAALCMDVIQRTNSLVDALDILRVLNLYSIRLDNHGAETVLKLYDQAKTDSAKWNDFVDYCTERSYFTLYEAAFKNHGDINQFSNTVFKLLEDMHGLNIQSNSSLYLRVGTRMNKVGALDDKARWEKTFGDYYPAIQNEVVQHLSTTSPSATTTVSSNDSTMADVRTDEALVLIQSGEFDKALVLMKEKIIEQGMVPTPTGVCSMILAANKFNGAEKASTIYDLVVGPFNQLAAGPRRKALHMLYNNMMVIHSNNKDLHATKMYYDKLRSDGMYPDSDGYGALLTCVSNDTTMNSSLDTMLIFEEAKKYNTKPTLYLYNVAISKLGKCRKMDQALALFNEMQENGVYPDSVTYSSIISTCLRCNSETQAIHYFDEMTRSSNSKPRIGAYNSMMQYYVRERGDRAKALVYFEKLKHTTLVPSIHTYRLLIEAYANTPDYDMTAACNVLTDMKKQYGLEAVASHYATLIHSYGCVHNDVASAEAMFDRITLAGIQSNEPVYRALLDTYISNNNNLPKAEALYKTMLDANIRSSTYIENLLIKGYGVSGEVEKAEQVFNKMTDGRSGVGKGVAREPKTYEAIAKVYMENGQVDKANQVRDEMKQRGFPIKMVDGVSLLIEQGQASVV